MHIQAKHDDRVLTCEKCEKKCIGGIKLKTHKEVTCNHCKKEFHTTAETVTWQSVLVKNLNAKIAVLSLTEQMV